MGKNIHFLILLLTGLSFNLCYGQDDQVLSIFNDQVDAFNKKDIDRLVNNVADDFKWFYITSDTLLLEVAGKENFKKSMENYFKGIPSIFSEIKGYAIDGNKISFREKVSWDGKKGRVSQSCIGIYDIREGKIFRAWYFIE